VHNKTHPSRGVFCCKEKSELAWLARVLGVGQPLGVADTGPGRERDADAAGAVLDPTGDVVGGTRLVHGADAGGAVDSRRKIREAHHLHAVTLSDVDGVDVGGGRQDVLVPVCVEQAAVKRVTDGHGLGATCLVAMVRDHHESAQLVPHRARVITTEIPQDDAAHHTSTFASVDGQRDTPVTCGWLELFARLGEQMGLSAGDGLDLCVPGVVSTERTGFRDVSDAGGLSLAPVPEHGATGRACAQRSLHVCRHNAGHCLEHLRNHPVSLVLDSASEIAQQENLPYREALF